MDIDDTIQVRCSRCKSKFRDKVRRLISGYSRQCPACEAMIFFEDGSPNKDIDSALREAAQVRKALRGEEAERVANQAATPAKKADDDDVDQPPVFSRRSGSLRSVSKTRS